MGETNQEHKIELYADVVVPLAIAPLTFAVPGKQADGIVPGCAVMVQLGARKFYMGIVWRVHDRRPDFKTKPIGKIIEGMPRLRPNQMKLWEWVSAYYMCTLGEVMRAGLPSALKPEGFSHEEFAREEFKPRTVQMISLGKALRTTGELNSAFEKLRRAPRQYQALIDFVDLVPEAKLFSAALVRETLGADLIILQALVKKDIFHIDTIELAPGQLPPLPSLIPVPTEAQRAAMEQIKEGFSTRETMLLHGVTGSGKTEIYINLIAESLAAGGNVLYLLPEIALTTQLIDRIRRYFGDRVVVYHSKFNDRRRAEIYRHMAESRGGEVLIGVRSSVFIPMNNLSLVIVDEEHENSFKQNEPAPRYHARDTAAVLAAMNGAKTLLGSATPSIETYMNARAGKYGLVTLSERYGDAALPTVIVADTLRAAKRGEKTSHFTHVLLDKIEAALKKKQQVMLFQNRRGFAPYIECPSCGWIPGCPHCNVTLTLHKAEGALKCHYCGYKTHVVTGCPSCKQGVPETRGFGTEKIEEELGKIFPEASIARLDRDTTQTEKRFTAIINDFEERRTDILVGTQMITKGFDFSGVSLVGILNADNMLNFPDFRAGERAYQLMTQVAGRAGRRSDRGEVVVQTSQPTHPVIRSIVDGDFEGMINEQLVERQSFFYPPYSKLIEVTMRFHDKTVLWRAGGLFEALSRKVFGKRLLGPETPLVDRVKGEYIVGFIIKIERDKSFEKARGLLREIITRVNGEREFRNVTVICNVDPH